MRNKRRNKKKQKFGVFTNLLVIIAATLLAGIVSFNLYLSSLPPIKQLQDFQPNLVSQIVSSDGEIIKTYSSFQFKKIDPKQIPQQLKDAIVATEDKKFYRHKGFDLIALFRSVLINVKAGRVKQGASTITQQLARILFLSNERTFDRKIKELIIAHRLEKTIPKEEILGMYLNNVYLGEGAYGVSAAAEIYFGKKLKDLTLAEIALLAGLPQAPSVYSPYQNPKLAKERRAQVLNRMRKMRYISRDEAKSAFNEEFKLNAEHKSYALNKAPYFCDYVTKELDSIGFSEQDVIQGGYKIYTTLNYKYQKVARENIQKELINWGLRQPNEQAAIYSFDASTGAILAYVGGKNYIESQFDRITQAVRPPGSSFKMFVYTNAIEKGMSPNDLIEDLPIEIADWTPHNYGYKYRIQLPMHDALRLSSNVVAARLIMDAGISDTIRLARRLGITTPLEADPTIALGSNGVKLFEITNAYGVLANGGIKNKIYAIEKIETSTGRVVYRSEPSRMRVLDLATTTKMTEMLKRVVSAGTGRGANFGRIAAGKTGTTDNYRDAWFIGYTPEIVTGVWVGNDNNTPTKRLTGGSIPAIIWRKYMAEAYKDLPKSDFDYPEFKIDEYELFTPVEIGPDQEYDVETGEVVFIDDEEDENLSIFDLFKFKKEKTKEDKDKDSNSLTTNVNRQSQSQNNNVINLNTNRQQNSQNLLAPPVIRRPVTSMPPPLPMSPSR